MVLQQTVQLVSVAIFCDFFARCRGDSVLPELDQPVLSDAALCHRR